MYIIIFLTETPQPEHAALFLRKLTQCCIMFDFTEDSAVSDIRSKEVKRACLSDLIDYISTTRGVITDASTVEIIKMVNKRPFGILVA